MKPKILYDKDPTKDIVYKLPKEIEQFLEEGNVITSKEGRIFFVVPGIYERFVNSDIYHCHKDLSEIPDSVKDFLRESLERILKGK